MIRAMCWLRGEWHLERAEWEKAGACFEEEIRMAREVNIDSSDSEVRLALTQLKRGQSHGIAELADRISAMEDPPFAPLAEVYLALRNQEKARKLRKATHRDRRRSFRNMRRTGGSWPPAKSRASASR